MPSNLKTSQWAATRSVVVFLRLEEGWSYEKIGRKTGCKRRTAERWVSEFKKTGKVQNLKRGRQSMEKRTPELLQLINKFMKGKEHHSSRKCVDFLATKGYQVSQRTVLLALKEDLGLFPYKKIKVPKLTEVHKQKRMAFCQENLDNCDDWADVAFSDECRFHTEPKPNSKNNVIWDDSPDDDKHFNPRSKYGGQSVEVWGAITPYGKTPLYFIERPMVVVSGRQMKRKFTALDYVNKILKKRLPAIKRLFEENGIDEWWFQQDGDPKHTAKVTQQWLELNTPHFTAKDHWPPNSPDLNIIENVWSVMWEELKKCRISNKTSLKRHLRRIWNDKITLDLIGRLYESIPRRFKAVLKANGNPAKY